MASASWLRLLKLDLALVALSKAPRPKPRRRPLRPRLAAEQLEDRTLPSGGPLLPGPAGHPPPTPPSHQGPATPTPPPGPAANSPEPGNRPVIPPGQADNGPGNGNGQGNDQGNGNGHGNGQGNDQGNGQGNGNDQGNGNGHGNDNNQGPPNVPPGLAGNGQGNGHGPGNGNDQGPQNPPPGLAGNGQGNDNGRGNDNGPPEVPPGLGDNEGGQGGQGHFGGPGTPVPPTGSSSAPGLNGSAAVPNEAALAAEEAGAFGAFAEEGGFAGASPASPGNGSASAIPEDNEGAVPSTGLGNASMPGMPLLPSSSPTAFSALVTGLLGSSSSADGFKNPANYPRTSDLDSLFLDLWDDDQLLFPDALPPIDETLFPEVMPKLDEMSAPSGPTLPDDFSSELGQNNRVPTAVPAAGEDTMVVGMEDAPAFALPGSAAGDAWSLAPFIKAAPVAVRFDPAASHGGSHAQPTHATGAAGPAVSRSQEWLDGVSIAPDAGDEPAPGENLRPYQIALGMMPFLPAFGYTPVSLRAHVRAGRRAWKRLRDYLHDW